ncbi:MAG: FAD binding domain-containing protein [Clostridiaceae bacterium]|nr:FAD binding domain-containing protein [Clostridiaceae bacterium]
MIPFDFDYYKPDSIEEAVNIYEELALKNKHPLYYSGGTEILTLARTKVIETGAVIDIKDIPQCKVFELRKKEIIIGAAVTLSQIAEAKYFPLLKKVTLFPADHSTRDKLTIGGNLCGTIIYKEVVLPLLISDSKILISGKKGNRLVEINQIFDRKLNLEAGELLVQISIPRENMERPFYAVKVRNQGVWGYPLISLAAVIKHGLLRVAVGGLCAFPFRSRKLEETLNNKKMTVEQRISEALKFLPAPISEDIQGSAGYKSFVFLNVLQETLDLLEGEIK